MLKRQNQSKFASIFVAMFMLCNLFIASLTVSADGFDDIVAKFGKWAKATSSADKVITPILDSNFQGKSDVFVLKNTTTEAQATDPWMNYLFSDNRLATNVQKFKINFEMYLIPNELNADHGLRLRFINTNGDIAGASAYSLNINFRPNGDLGLDGAAGSALAASAFTLSDWQTVEIEVRRVEMTYSVKVNGVEKVTAPLPSNLSTNIYGISLAPVYTNRNGNAIFAMDNFSVTDPDKVNLIEKKFGVWTAQDVSKEITPILDNQYTRNELFVLKNTTTLATATDPWVNYMFANNDINANMEKFKINFDMHLNPTELDAGQGLRFRLMSGQTTQYDFISFLPNGNIKMTGLLDLADVTFAVNSWQSVEIEVCPADMTWSLEIEGDIKVSNARMTGSMVNIYGINLAPVYTNLDGNSIFAMDNFSVTKLQYVDTNLAIITDDFPLPAKTNDDKDIIWKSSDATALLAINQSSENEGMAYVIRGAIDKRVKLTAEIDMGGYTDYETTTYIVSADPNTKRSVFYDFEDIEIGELPSDIATDGKPRFRRDPAIASITPDLGDRWGFVDFETEALPTGTSGNRVLRIGHNSGVVLNALVYMNLDTLDQGIIELEYKYYAFTANYGHFWGINKTAETIENADLFRVTTNNSSIVVQNGIGSNITISNLANQWNKVKTTANLATRKFSVYVNDAAAPQANNIDLRSANNERANDLRQFTFGYVNAEAGGQQYLIDDIRITEDIEQNIRTVAESFYPGDISEVTKNIRLVSEVGENVTIQWFSSNPAALNSNGKVTQCEEDVSVTLYALFELDGIRMARAFDVMVKRFKNDEDSVAADFDEVFVPATVGLTTTDIPLPTVGAYGSVISWTSSHPDIIDHAGKVTPLHYDDMRITKVTLTGTVKKGSVEKGPLTFTFYVPERNYVLSSTISGSSDRGDGRYGSVADNDSATSWLPAETDTKKYIDVQLPSPTLINYAIAKGSFGSAEVAYSLNGGSYLSLGSGGMLTFNPVTVRYVRFTFKGNNIAISDLGVYYVETDELRATLDANDVAANLGNLLGISSNLTLPTVGSRGSTISWTSSNTEYLSNNGQILKRLATGSVEVTLTMNVTNGTEDISRSFRVTIARTGSGNAGGNFSGGSGGGGSMPYIPLAPLLSEISPTTPSFEGFTDINDFSWAKAEIEEFAAQGYISGVGNGRFEPERPITREEFLTILIKVFGLNKIGIIPFKDVSSDAWYHKSVSVGYMLGIVKGESEDTFGVGKNITRQDMAVMAANAAHATGIILSGDAMVPSDMDDIADYAVADVVAHCGAGIIRGYEDGSFQPYNETTRAEAVVILHRLKSLGGM